MLAQTFPSPSASGVRDRGCLGYLGKKQREIANCRVSSLPGQQLKTQNRSKPPPSHILKHPNLTAPFLWPKISAEGHRHRNPSWGRAGCHLQMSPADVTCARLQPLQSPPWQCHPARLTRDRNFSPGQEKPSANTALPACLTPVRKELLFGVCFSTLCTFLVLCSTKFERNHWRQMKKKKN